MARLLHRHAAWHVDPHSHRPQLGLRLCHAKDHRAHRTSSEPGRYLHFSENEVVYNAGEWVDGFYVVVEGELLLTVKGTPGDSDADFTRRFGPKEHWGERIIEDDCVTTG